MKKNSSFSEENNNYRLSYTMDFESVDDFSLEITPWSVHDIDEAETYGFDGIDFLNEYEPMAYIAFKPSATNPPINEQAIQPYQGLKFGACFASVDEQNNDWLITQQLQLGDNSYMSFRVKSYTDDYGLERYNVAISNTGNEPGDFSVISGTMPKEAPVESWVEDYYDLSAFNGEQVYIAIQCVSNNAFIFMIDDIVIEADSIVYDFDELDNHQFTLYPNPANNFLLFDTDPELKDLRVFNSSGNLVKLMHNPDNKIEVGDLEPGIYYYSISTMNQENSYSGKFIIQR